ncbi:TIGR01459 family HAD-type hydrolase [Sphingomonas sp.]|uniref:TIGR01459 family HAD-type hydrolase n=1 Tax=Sphingomonas sp. TaxID=28214 RepID=UPI00286A6C36|nr:TIGR01459 family HAD-type hydrolase [Sphingomonas sp.]
MTDQGFDLDALDPHYTTILCDLWGVVHDGFRLLPGSAARLLRWAGEGRRTILITNAPRTATTVQAQLDQLGLPRSSYQGISTGGQAGIDALLALGEPVGFLGTRFDRREMKAAGLRFVDASFRDLCCTGLDDERLAVADYAAELAEMAARGVRLHCLNPDRVVIHDSVAEVCAGALADGYEALGGEARWYGKPFPAIYDHALALAGNPPRETVMAVGDGLPTDVLGAAQQGLHCLFVSGGIHADAPFPTDFAARNGLGGWAPIGVVKGLA